MNTFPLIKPLDSKSFMATACHLYQISILKLLPFSLLAIVFYNFIRFGEALFPRHAPLFQQLAMFALFLLLPIVAMLFPALDKIGKGNSFSFSSILLLSAQRFLSLMGSIISMMLFPLIVLGLCVGIYLFLVQQRVAYPYLFGWIMLSYFLILSTMITKIMAPILVLVDGQDANSAVDESARLVSGYYVKTFMYVLYAALLVILLARIPHITHSFFPTLTNSVPNILLEGVAQILLVIVGPWSFALLLTYKYDLQVRQQTTSIGKPPSKVMVAPIHKNTQAENNKFNF